MFVHKCRFFQNRHQYGRGSGTLWAGKYWLWLRQPEKVAALAVPKLVVLPIFPGCALHAPAPILGVGEPDVVINVGVSGPGVVRKAI